MPETTTVPQPTGPEIAHSIPDAAQPFVAKTPTESQQLDTVTKELKGIHPEIKSAGPHIPVQPDLESATGVATPITMPAPEEPKDTKTTHWWNFMQRKRSIQKVEKEELKDAA